MAPTPERLKQIDTNFRTANYIGAAQLFLKSNALLREPLKREHIKARLLGHWGTQPGLNLIYVHLNRLMVHHRPQPSRFHVRGYIEEGTPTTPFDMTVINEMSRFHLAMEALRRAPRMRAASDEIFQRLHHKLIEHRAWIQCHDEDMPEILKRKWSDPQSADPN